MSWVQAPTNPWSSGENEDDDAFGERAAGAGPLHECRGRDAAAGRASPVSLDEQGLLDAARRATGLDDFGGDELPRAAARGAARAREPRRGSRCSAGSRPGATCSVCSPIACGSRRTGGVIPEIAAEEVRQPLFIVGLPRTGSTLLHHLLAQDPGSRVAQAWEVMFPSPPPEAASYESDPRIAKAARQLQWLDALTPDFKTIHPLGAQLALECIAIMSPTFLSPRFHTTYHVPTYQEWLERQDLRPAYRFHRRFLQQLQWRTPARRWVLKAPAHLCAFDALFETYPDALVVQTHRDPSTVLASVASLTAVLQGAFTDELDPLEIGLEVSRRWTDGLERAMRVRQQRPRARRAVLRRALPRAAADPMAVIAAPLRPLRPAAHGGGRAAMRRHLAANPKDKHGAHRYSLGTFGLEADDLVRRFKAYREYYGVPREEASSQ